MCRFDNASSSPERRHICLGYGKTTHPFVTEVVTEGHAQVTEGHTQAMPPPVPGAQHSLCCRAVRGLFKRSKRAAPSDVAGPRIASLGLTTASVACPLPSAVAAPPPLAAFGSPAFVHRDPQTQGFKGPQPAPRRAGEFCGLPSLPGPHFRYNRKNRDFRDSLHNRSARFKMRCIRRICLCAGHCGPTQFSKRFSLT